MRYFLIDFENVQSEGLEGVEHLRKQDKVMIFFSKNANKISIQTVENIVKSQAEISYMEISSLGHNALDFNLVYFIGVQAGKFRGTRLEMHIISKDSGFDTVRKHPLLEGQERISITRHETIKAAIKGKVTENIVNDILTKYAFEKYSEHIVKVLKISATKADFHNNLIKELGKEDGKKVYSTIRGDFEKMKQS